MAVIGSDTVSFTAKTWRTASRTSGLPYTPCPSRTPERTDSTDRKKVRTGLDVWHH